MLTRLINKSLRTPALARCFAEPAKAQIVTKGGESAEGVPTKFQYIDNELKPVNQLVLRTRQSIEEYVMKTIKEYFRTTHRANLTMSSNLLEHGLDSLDLVEVAMQVETDLGYLIASENLPAFTKPVHFANYIEQVENFKTQYGRNPLP